jgi:hypothetical protein
MERLEAELYPSGCVPLIYNIVEVMVEEKRKHRNVTIPAAALAVVMQLAGRKCSVSPYARRMAADQQKKP